MASRNWYGHADPIEGGTSQAVSRVCTQSSTNKTIMNLLVDGLEGSSGDVTSVDLGDGVASSEETDGGTVVITGREVFETTFDLSTSSSSLSYQ